MRLLRAVLLYLAALSGAFAWGLAAGHHQVWPFGLLQDARNLLRSSGPAPMKPRASLFEIFSPKADVVMIGDSITESAPWEEMFPGRKIANRGINGDTSADVLARMATILSVRPEKAVVMLGVNDVSQGRDEEEILSDFAGIMDGLRKAGVVVVLLSTLECRCPRQVAGIRALNKKLAGIAAMRGAAFLDLNASMAGGDGLLPEYTFDGTHLTGRGYQALAVALEPYMPPETQKEPAP